MDRFTRSRIIFGEDFDKIRNAKIILLGVGGVGGFCLDALYRSGVKDITIVDFDTFDITNQNRQLGSEELGRVKVEVMKERYKGIEAIELKITKNWVENFDFTPYDLVIDAIDDMPAKVAVANKCYTKLISSTGGAKKLDPTRIKITSVWKTYSDGLAKKFRYELKKSGFSGDFNVVFSDEEPNCKDLGSFVGVTGSFGLTLASLAIKKITDR
ncbi:MAG: tRNA threonylcarbamoyladenosine dehydratase [Sulfurospirillaceae bacterium]|nr:tRNA threonylcarbamoyladenosine dehydratase [Sulfurospirillaceae bacterium]